MKKHKNKFLKCFSGVLEHSKMTNFSALQPPPWGGFGCHCIAYTIKTSSILPIQKIQKLECMKLSVSCYKVLSVNYFLFSAELTFKFISKVVTNIYPSYILITNPFQVPHRTPRLRKLPLHQEKEAVVRRCSVKRMFSCKFCEISKNTLI